MVTLVTGGAGFIGSHLVQKLMSLDIDTVCLDNFNDFYDPEIKRRNIEPFDNNRKFRLVEGDIRDRSLLEEIFQRDTIRTVVHLAAMPGVRPSIRNPELYEDVNVKGTINLLEACVRNKVERFIFGSSSSVYGVAARLPFREDDTGIPISPYAVSKKSAELYCRTFNHLYGLPVCCLRFFTVYGPRQRPEMAIHKFSRYVYQGLEIPVYGDGTSERDYTYIDDIIEGTVAALDKEFDFEIFNLGNSESVKLGHIISLIEKHIGRKAQLKMLPDQPGDVPVTYADITKAHDFLGFKPKVKIEEGIERFVAWFKQTNRG